MSLSLLLQQCPTVLVRLTLIVFVMGGGWLQSKLSAILKIHFFVYALKSDDSFDNSCRCADVFLGGIDRISNFFVLNHLVFILYTILKKYLDTQNEFIFNKTLIIMI